MEKYQTFWRRVGAAILDSIILFFINWIVSVGTMLIGAMLSISPTMLTLAVPGLISAFYYILMHYYYGQTIGKMTANVKVLDESGKRVAFGQAILRSLPYLFLPMFAVSFSTANEVTMVWVAAIYGLTSAASIVNVIVCLANDKRRSLYDFIARTIVVRIDV